MVRIAISQAAFDAIAKTLALGSVGYENKTDEQGNRLIWLPPEVVDRAALAAGRGRELQRRDFADRGTMNTLTNQDIKKLREEHEARVWRTFLWAIGLCACAILPPLFSMLGCFKNGHSTCDFASSEP